MTEWPSDHVVALYESTPRSALLQVLVLEYRCPSSCLLLHAWRTPGGLMWYRPRNTLSHAVAESDLVEAARIKHTSDGERKWLATGGSLDEFLEFFADDPDAAGALSMNCHHLRNVQVLCDRLARDTANVTPGQPTRATITP
jgi:hypothetical protein